MESQSKISGILFRRGSKIVLRGIWKEGAWWEKGWGGECEGKGSGLGVRRDEERAKSP